jgi:hypothetical protein
VTDSSSVTALSHIGVQIFGHSHGRWFTYVPEETAILQTKRFSLLPPQNFLLLLQSSVKTNQTQLVEVSLDDVEEFNTLTSQKQLLEIALSKYKDGS